MILSASSARKKYESLKAARQPFLDRARQCAELTIPSLYPREETVTSTTNYSTPYNSVGARGINSLASKLLMSQLPPNSPFFRLKMSDIESRSMGQPKGKLEEGLAMVERAALEEMEKNSLRVPVYEGLRLLLVGGNALVVEDGLDTRVFRLDRYVVKRDPMGNVLEIITHETLAPSVLPQELKDSLQETATVSGQPIEDFSTMKTVDLYTHLQRKGTGWESYQEVMGHSVPKSRKTYPKDKCPWLPLRFNRSTGEDYGRSLVEEYFGDLRSLETLSKAIVQGSAAAAKILLMVSPNGSTKIREVRDAPNGGVINGDANDVSILQLNKYADFRVAKELMAELKQQLEASFLMGSAIQRQGERVTAEEIRYMAQELEGALGGLYSVLATELQKPLVVLTLNRMQAKRQIPDLPGDMVKLQITTGIEALGRGAELTKLGHFLRHIQPFGPEVMAAELNVGDYIDRVGANLGIDTSGLIKSPEQKQQEAEQKAQQMQQAQAMDMAGKVAPQLTKGMMDGQQRNNPPRS